jgi:hypothetical protein
VTDHQVWDGVTLSSSLTDQAVRARHDLADRAKNDDWSGVVALLTGHPEMANLTRLDGSSRYAPLHQAAHAGATAEVAERLIELGAWRLLRTANGELPIDIARRRGHHHLLDVLQPRPAVEIGANELADIQQHFHEVIRGRVAALVDQHALRLPELAVLTEADPPAAYFAVPGMYGGFAYRLETADPGWRLVSESWWRVIGGSGQRHEITARGARRTAQGFV